MRLRDLSCFLVDIPAPSGEYVMSGGRRLRSFPSLIVKVTAEDGTTGYGEAGTLGANYLDGFPASAREAVRLLAPWVFECDVFDAGVLVDGMDQRVRGHLPGKAAIDIALWDLRARLLGAPVAQLLGGVKQGSFGSFYAVSLASPADMVEQARRARELGYTGWQLKLGADPVDDARRVHAVADVVGDGASFVTNDANGGWPIAQALRFLAATDDVDAYLEQPCRTMDELARVRAVSTKPVIVDESVTSPGELLRAVGSGCAEAINLKLVRVGGLTKAARIRDIAEAAGWMVLVDEAQGADIATAAIAQLSATVEPAQLLGGAYFMGEETKISYQRSRAATGPRFADGLVTLSGEPGLGVSIDDSKLGAPALIVRGDEL